MLRVSNKKYACECFTSLMLLLTVSSVDSGTRRMQLWTRQQLRAQRTKQQLQAQRDSTQHPGCRTVTALKRMELKHCFYCCCSPSLPLSSKDNKWVEVIKVSVCPINLYCLHVYIKINHLYILLKYFWLSVFSFTSCMLTEYKGPTLVLNDHITLKLSAGLRSGLWVLGNSRLYKQWEVQAADNIWMVIFFKLSNNYII